MFRILTLTLILTFLSIVSFGQKEANVWYFGQNSGLNFNTNPATILTDGKMNTREGVAVISDKNTGQLIFYTEGTIVWSRNHVPMPNGTGLQGDYSSTQSAVIVPNPANTNKYYIFTTAINQGFRYSEVDMTLNGGLGDVIAGTKNNLLIAPAISTEKVIAARHCNGKDYWVITHTANSKDYMVYLVTSLGIAPLPLVFSVGTTLRKVSGDYELTGYLKLSPDASKLANAIGTNMDMSSSPVEVFDFNNATGVISGPFVQLSSLASPYGIEFSPSAKLIYVTEIIGKKVSQFNLTASNINASRIDLASSNTLSYGALQLAPDGKIYVAAENGYTIPYNFLSTINNPNTAGSGCNYQANSISLGSTSALIGLPTFAASFLKDTSGFSYQASCASPNINFDLTYTGNIDSVKWDFGDASLKSTTLAPSHAYSANGTFNVQLVIYRKCNTNDTIKRAVTTRQASNITLTKFICSGDFFTLADGRRVTQSGVYPVTLQSAAGCDSIITTTLGIYQEPFLNLGNDTLLCSSGSLLLNGGTGFTSYKWQDGSSNPVYNAKGPGLYWLEVQSTATGCSKRDSINIGVGTGSSFSLGNDTSICNSQSITLGKVVNNATSYLWSTGSVNPQISASVSQIYWVEIKTADGCTKRDSINLGTNPVPQFSLGKDTAICKAQSIILGKPLTDARSYLWSTGSTAVQIVANNSGTYWQEITNTFGCSNRDSIFLATTPSPIFSIGRDTAICDQQTINLGTVVNGAVSYLWNTGATSSQISINAPDTYWMEVETNNGCKSRDSVLVNLNGVSKFSLGEDPSLCEGQNTLLSALTNGASYLWSNGSSSAQITVNIAGTFWAEISLNGCQKRDSVEVIVHKTPHVVAQSSNDIDCTFPQAQLTANGATSYTWTPSTNLDNSTIPNPIVRTNSTTTYHLKGTDIYGCIGEDSITVKVTETGKSSFNLPNAFTPNGDGRNDCFGITRRGLIDLVDFSIYNRYGNKVFSTKDPSKCWDGTYKGKLQDPGGFVYVIKANSNCGNIFTKGIVMLVR